jgi:hypothetical protein
MGSLVQAARSAGAILTVAIAAAGCGGGSGDGGGGSVSFAEGGTPRGTPTSAEVVGCLRTAGRRAGFTVSESAADLDPIASRASDRAVAIGSGGRKAIVIFERTAQEAGTIVDRYRSAPLDQRGSGYAQSGTIVIVDKGYGVPTPKPILDCTKYGTKEQGGGSAPTRPPPPPPVDLDESQAKVYARSQVADADFGTVALVRVQDPRPAREPFVPKAGSRFIGVTFKITGKARLGYRGFSLYGKGDRQYDQIPDPAAFSAGTIDKGETKRGLVIFEVPKSVEAGTLRFHIDPPLGANDSVELELG